MIISDSMPKFTENKECLMNDILTQLKTEDEMNVRI